MLTPVIPKYVRRRRGPTARRVRALGLVSAAYTPESGATPARLTLTFDRAVDVAGADAPAFSVRVGAPVETRYRGDGTVTNVTPRTVRVDLLAEGSFAGEETLLDVGPGNGLAAADDGGTWAGIDGAALPFVASPLVMTSATFEATSPEEGVLRLGFDQPVAFSPDADMGVVLVFDAAVTHMNWQGAQPVAPVDAFTLAIPMNVGGAATGTGTRLHAGPDTQIRAADDPIGWWDGVEEVELPYGA